MARYWDDWWSTRSSRRRLLGTSGAAAVGVAGLALTGCGDDDDAEPSAATPTAPAGSSPVVEKPKVGGTWRFPLEGMSSGDPPTLFPYENLTYLAQMPSSWHYSRLLRSKSGPGISGTDYSVKALEGDVVAKWEQPNDTTYVFTLKPNIKFHRKPPMNGRAMTAQDLLRTYDAFIQKSQNANGWKLVIDKFEAPDEKTIRITLKEPFAPFLSTHASSAEAFWIIPVESIDGGQATKDPVGTGPYVFDDYETGVAMRWKRNPEFYDPVGYNNYEAIAGALIKDPQRIIAALQAGEFDYSTLSGTVYQEAKNKLDPKGTEYFELPGGPGGFYFNYDNKPWNDMRVRQALSMAMDRTAILKALDQTGKGDSSSHIASMLSPYWMSPVNSNEWGDSGKFWKYDPAESKKLLQAATGSDTIKFTAVANIDRYGEAMKQLAELLQSTMKKGGFDFQLEYMEYGAYIQSIFVGKIPEGKVGLGPWLGTPRDPDDNFFRNYHTSGPRHNWGGTPIPEQAELDKMFEKSRTILNPDERVKYVKDVQRRMAVVQNLVPYIAGSAYGYAQPWVKGYHHRSGYAASVEALAKTWFTDERLKKG